MFFLLNQTVIFIVAVSKYYKNKPANRANNQNRFYRSKKRNCVKHEEMLRHLSSAHNSTVHETEQLLDLLVGNCDGWLQVIDIGDTRYVKKVKLDMSVQQVKRVVDGKIKSLSWPFHVRFSPECLPCVFAILSDELFVAPVWMKFDNF